jgi:hypothetical protein
LRALLAEFGMKIITLAHFLPQARSMAVSLVSNAYLDDNSAKIRSKPVPWEVNFIIGHPLTQAPYSMLRVINVQVWSPSMS